MTQSNHWNAGQRYAYGVGIRRGREELNIELLEARAQIKALVWVVKELGGRNVDYIEPSIG